MSRVLSCRKAEGVVVVSVAERLTLNEGVASLRNVVRDLAGQGHKRILLDLAGVKFHDSSGIGELVSAFIAVTNHGGQIKLLHLPQGLKEKLQIVRLYKVFEVFDDEARAIHSF